MQGSGHFRSRDRDAQDRATAQNATETLESTQRSNLPLAEKGDASLPALMHRVEKLEEEVAYLRSREGMIQQSQVADSTAEDLKGLRSSLVQQLRDLEDQMTRLKWKNSANKE